MTLIHVSFFAYCLLVVVSQCRSDPVAPSVAFQTHLAVIYVLDFPSKTGPLAPICKADGRANGKVIEISDYPLPLDFD